MGLSVRDKLTEALNVSSEVISVGVEEIENVDDGLGEALDEAFSGSGEGDGLGLEFSKLNDHTLLQSLQVSVLSLALSRQNQFPSVKTGV